ncbi:hypothetical protein [Luteolibacter sp. Populi]|uniref:hypothetical protein n=1 Tax=Luteolibacter sp. Populi TaxID=3230487 RepID=UPI0034663493
MTSKTFIAGALLSLALVVVIWRPWEHGHDPVPPPPPSDPAAPGRAPAANDPELPANTGPRIPAAPPPPQELDPKISPKDLATVRAALDNLGFTLRDYGAALKGNPVGTNAEITAALLGDNPKQLKLEIPVGSTLNAKGELCDPWGTPWFFHQLGTYKTEIRSAGPDRKMYNSDDFVR